MAIEEPPVLSTGRYQTAEELGRGGWGTVVRAKDQQLDRDVAVKQIHGEYVENDSIRDRFCHEARVTASLQHPGVAPVHELGVGGDGAPYYVMKLLEGPTLKDAIRDIHATPSRVANGYSIELLERFIDICNTVAYAHQQQIIHRDLKPSNVLVGQFGETVVVDWGLAKRLDESAPKTSAAAIEATFAPGSGSYSALPSRRSNTTTRRSASAGAETRHGAVLGTPAYMSPEQSRGEVDSLTPATDIYALGVMLYEMITGENPFRTDSVETTISRVQEGEYQPPRLVNKRAPRQLEAICIKALSRDPQDRYPTAEAIVQDVQSFLAGDPVSVCRDSLVDKLGRWRRRRPGLAIGLLASATMLLVGSILFGVVIQRAHAAERSARLAAEQAKRAALQRLADAREAGDAWLIDLSGSLEFFPGMDGLRQNLLNQAVTHYRGLAKGVDTDSGMTPEETLELARCQLRLGDLNRLLGDSSEARASYQSAQRQCDQALAGLEADHSIRDDLTLQRINARIGLLLMGDPVDASSDEAWLAAQANSSDTRQHQEATSALVRMAIALARSSSPLEPNNIERLQAAESNAVNLASKRGEPRDHQLLQTIRDELTLHLRDAGRLSDAARVWAAEVSRLNKLIVDQPARPDLLQARAFARMRVAGLHARMRHNSEAESDYREAITDLHEAWRLSDADAYFHRNVAISHANLGQTATDPAAAIEQYQHAITQLREAVNLTGPTPSDMQRLAACEASLGELAALRRDAKALTHFDAADQCYALLKDHNELTPARALRRAEALASRAAYQVDIDDPISADVDLDRAQEIIDALLKEGTLRIVAKQQAHRLSARLAGIRSECLLKEGDEPGAKTAATERLKSLAVLAGEEKLQTSSDNYPVAMRSLVDALIEQPNPTTQQLAQAAKWLAEMRRQCPACGSSADWLSRSALVHWRRGKQELAARSVAQALAKHPGEPLMQVLQEVLNGKAEEVSKMADEYLSHSPGDRRFRFWATTLLQAE